MATNRGFIFGFGSCAILNDDNDIVGSAHVTGALTVEIMAQATRLMGGASSYPVDQRLARSEGNLTLTLNERRPWLDELLNEGEKTETAAASAAVGAIQNIMGSTLAAKLTVAVKTGQTPKPGYYVASATAAAVLSIEYFGPAGGGVVEVTGITNSAKDIPNTGLTVQAASASPAFGSGNKVAWEVTPAHGGRTEIKIAQVRKGVDYEFRAFSALPASKGNIEEVRIPRVQFQGPSYGLTDNEYSSSGVEITGTVLAPLEGGSPFTRISYQPE